MLDCMRYAITIGGLHRRGMLDCMRYAITIGGLHRRGMLLDCMSCRDITKDCQ